MMLLAWTVIPLIVPGSFQLPSMRPLVEPAVTGFGQPLDEVVGAAMICPRRSGWVL
jgi:hypothetical protein